MYKVRKRMEIAACHRLCLSYDSPCSGLHGHNWIVEVVLEAGELNGDGMVADFGRIKKEIHGRLDHRDLSKVLPFNTTAENLAKWIAVTVQDNIGILPVEVMVQESEGNCAWWFA